MDVPQLLRQFTMRYQRALLAKVGVLSALLVGTSLLLAWRLSLTELTPLWRVGLPVLLGAGSLASLAWWMSRRWISVRAAAAYVDRRLGLQQQLLTAVEFAQTQPAPALYQTLLEDVQQRYAANRIQVPRLLDRTAGIITILVLLLLLWPGGRPAIRLPGSSSPPKTSPPSPQPEQSQPQPPQGSQGSGSPQPSGQGRDASASSDQSGQSGQQGGQNGQDSSQAGTSPGDQQGDGDESSADQRRDGAGQSGGEDRSSGTSETSEGTSESSGNQASARDGQAGRRGQGASQRGQQQRDEGRQASAAKSSTSAGASGSSDQRQQGTSGTSSQSAGQQPGSAVGNDGNQLSADQTVLKAQIQELLKEVSGELQQLQQQLAASNQQEPPQPGTQTDPDLYEQPDAPTAPSGSRQVPVQLETDTVGTSTPRPGSGTAPVGGVPVTATPQAPEEDAQLTDVPREEAPVSRQPIPPEYRSVFEQLQQQSPSGERRP